MSYLVLVRHGESEWNALGKWTGWIDITLSNKGREQARRAAREIADITFHQAFTSDLKRAQETLAIIKVELGLANLPTIIEPAFKERHYGIYTGLVKWEIKAQVGEKQFKKLRRGWDEPIPEGETLKDVHARVIPAYQRHIFPLISDSKNVLFVAHGNSIRALVKHIEKIPNAEIAEFELATGEIIVFHLDKKGKPIKREKRAISIDSGKQ